MADIDRLTIEISADASSATKSINNLVKAIDKLNKSLSSLDTSGIESFSKIIQDLANSVDILGKSTESVRETSKAFKDLGKAASSVKKAKDATQDLAESATGLSVVNTNINDVATVSNSLMSIFQRMVAAFSNIGSGSRHLNSDMDVIDTTFREISGAINEITEACYSLISAFAQVVTSFNAISGSSQKLIEESNIIDTTFREIEEPVKRLGAASEVVSNLGEGMKNVDSTPIEDASKSAERLNYNFLKVSNVVDNIKSKFKGVFVPTKSFKSLEEEINKVVKKYNELLTKMQEAVNTGQMSVGDDKYTKMAAQLDALRNKYDELILKQKELALEGNAVRLNPNVEKTLGSFKSGFTAVTNVVKNGFVAGLRTANSALKSFGTRIKTTLSSMAKSITSGHKATDMAKKFANEIYRVSKMLKLMVTRMALRKVIEEVGNGFKSLALHSEEFNQSVSGMMNGAKKLGYSFAAMISPLINALAPAIQYVINLLTKLLNIINQVFSAFTGKTTYNRSKDFSENWKDNIEAANKSAKELKKTVLGFDELNQMQDKQTSGGDTSGNIVDMFETVDIDPKWKKFADWMKEMWKVGDFTELGKKIGEKIRDMLESIPWDLIRKTANKLGKSLATLINGFVEVERLGYDIGYTIAQSVNTVFEFLNGFVHNLHWDSIGKFIAETFNGFFENIDWALIKDTVVTGLAGLAESIQTFINEFHWDNISDFIINGVDTIVSGIKAFFEGIDWLDLGKKMGDQLSKSIEGIDFKEVGHAIGDIIKAAVDWVTGMLDTMPSVETMIQKVTDLMHGLFDRVDFKQIGANLGIILQNIYDFLTGFWDENGEEIKNKVKEFFEGFWDNIDKDDLQEVIGKILGAAILAGIAAAGWKALTIVLAEKIKVMVAGAAGSAGASASAAGVSVAAAVVAGIVSFFAGAELGKYIGKNIFPDDAELYEGYSGVMGTIKMVKDTVVAAYDLWVMKAEESWETLKNIGLLYKAGFLTLVTEIKTRIDEIVEKFTQFKGHLEMKIGEIRTVIKGKIAEIKEDISEFIKNVKSFFSADKWTFSGVAEGLKKTFGDAVDGVKKIWDKMADTLNGEYEIGNMKFNVRLPKFYAMGGFPEDGFFYANHNELVGQFSNGKTAVANNAQIVEGIQAGVYNAVSMAMSRNTNNGGGYIANTIVVDGEVIARTVTKAQQRQNMRYSPNMG